MTSNPAADRLVVWTVVASHFGPPFMFSGVAVALPGLGHELGAGATSLGLVETTFLVGSLALLLPAGRLADAGDKRWLFRFGMLAFAVLSIAIAASSSLPLILLLRFLQGAASALFAATSTALLADLVPIEHRGRVFGAAMGVIYAGLSLGPMVAGWLVSLWSWRLVFLVGAGVILICWLLVGSRLPSAWRRPARVVHWPSVALMVAAVACATAGSAALGHGWFGVVGLSVAIALAVAFVAVQLRVGRPLLDLGALMANRPLRAALFVQLVVYLNAFCSMFLLSLFLQVTIGCSAVTAGQVLALGGVVMAVVAPIAGRLADRWSPRPVLGCGIAAVVGSALLARTLGEQSGVGHVAAVLVLQGAGFGLFSSPNMAIVMASMPRQQSGMASALAAKARSIGMVTGMMLTAGLLSLDVGDEPVAHHPLRFADTMTTVYTVLAGTAMLALIVVLSVRPVVRAS